MSFIAAAIIGATTIGGALISRSASNTQAAAADRANQTQWDIYNQNRTDTQPWRDAGASVLPQLTSGLAEGGKFNRDFTMADFEKDPGYDFRMQEGVKALERSRAARSGLYGGATGKGIARYAQDYASGEYTNAFNRYMMQRNSQFNRLSGLAGTGQTANEQLANQGMNYANQYGNNVTGAANARASGYVGAGNALTSGVGQYINNNQNQQWLQYLQGRNAPLIQGNFGSAGDPLYG